VTQPPLYHSYDPTTERATEITADSDAGGLTFVHAQNTRQIVESAKRIASNFDPHRRNPDGFTHVARIPMVIWRQLQRLGITKDEKALNAWLDARDNRVFRTDDARKL
jgi:hypothetical protein